MVEECLYAVRTVVAFGGEFRELDKFGRALVHTRRGEVAIKFFASKKKRYKWVVVSNMIFFYIFIPL